MNFLFILATNADIITRPQNISTVTGRSVQLTCSTSGTAPVNWEFMTDDKTRYDRIYSTGTVVNVHCERFVATHESTNKLTILNASLSDAGSYKCRDNAGQGPQVATATLNVIGEFGFIYRRMNKLTNYY